MPRPLNKRVYRNRAMARPTPVYRPFSPHPTNTNPMQVEGLAQLTCQGPHPQLCSSSSPRPLRLRVLERSTALQMMKTMQHHTRAELVPAQLFRSRSSNKQVLTPPLLQVSSVAAVSTDVQVLGSNQHMCCVSGMLRECW